MNQQGRGRMVNVAEKQETQRMARAAVRVRMAEDTVKLIQENRAAKGDVLAVAQVAGIMAAKNTANLIPMCHPLGLDGVDIRFFFPDYHTLLIESTVYNTGRTGVEMEAMTAVSVAALTVYDMVKAVDRFITIDQAQLVEKRGGKSGIVLNPALFGKIKAISINPQRGELKTPVEKAVIKENWGIEGDGHGGDWERQVTVLKSEAVAELASRYGLDINPGEMAENILTEGIDLNLIGTGARIKLGDSAILEVSQVGKEDHPSVVVRRFGRSLLPRQGLFCSVVAGGVIKPGDKVELLVP